MTATAPTSPTRSPRRLPALARAIGVFVASLVLVSSPGLASAAPSPSPTAGPAASSAAIAPLSNGTLRPDEALNIWVTAESGLTRTASTVSAAVSLGAAPLADRAAVSAWVAGESATTGLTPIGSAALGPLASGERKNAIVSLAADDPALLGRAPGVYPLFATVAGLGPLRTARSVITVAPAGELPKTPVLAVVPISLPRSGTGVVDAAQLATLTAPEGSLTAQLDAVDGTGAVLAVDPAILASIRLLGSSAPASATTWLARLDGLANARFALQYGDADVSAQVLAGLSRPLQPTSFIGYMSPSDFSSTPTPTPAPTGATATPTPSTTVPSAGATPSPTPSPAAALPTAATLVALDGALPTTYWTPTGSADAAVVDALTRAVDAGAPPPLTLVSSHSTAAGASGGAVAGHASAGPADLLVYDTAVSTALRDAAEASDTVSQGAALAAAAAHLSLAADASGATPLVVTIDRPSDPTRAGLRAAILAATDGLRTGPTTLAAVLGTPPQPAALVERTNDDDRAGVLATFGEGEAALAQLATVLSDPELLTGRERAEILRLLGAGWIAEPELWRTALAAHATATAATLHAVSILPPTEVTLVSNDSFLPVWIRNDLPWPVTVVLTARPDSLRLEVDTTTRVEGATPLGNTRVQVPVQAKVGNGEVNIRLTLHSTSGVAIGTEQSSTVNVRAEWERIGLTAIAIAGLGLVAIGVVRMVRRRRRRSGSAPEQPEVS